MANHDVAGEGVVLDGRFQLGELLGAGATAAVYAAEVTDGSSPERVAVKILHAHLAHDDESRAGFLREAQLAAGLDHPNIARVVGSGVELVAGEPVAWIAEELVPAGSVADYVRVHGPLSMEQAIVVLLAVLDALAAAHSQRIVHRDVTPGNVLLARADPGVLQASDVRLADFGLADVSGRVARARQSGARAGEVVGSAAFVCPEHAQGQPVLASGDVYQVGALGYFLLTGRPPYVRASVEDTVAAHIHAPVPVVSALAPGARLLDPVLATAMAKHPARRFRDAAAFRAALESVLEANEGEQLDPDAVRTVVVTHRGPAALEGTMPFSKVSGQALPYLESSGQVNRPPQEPMAPEDVPAHSGPSAATGVLVSVVVIALIGLALWGAASGADGQPLAEPSSAAPTAVASVAPTTSAAPTPTPTSAAAPSASAAPTSLVPTLSGTVNDASAQLASVGLSLGSVLQVSSAQAAGVVVGQGTPADSRVARGSMVDVQVASGSNVVPDVVGMTLAQSRAALATAGFVAVGAGLSGASVVEQRPAAGTLLHIGSNVLVVAGSSTPSTPTPSP